MFLIYKITSGTSETNKEIYHIHNINYVLNTGLYITHNKALFYIKANP